MRDLNGLVFPIHIGINREGGFRMLESVRVPYTHRDKPCEIFFRTYIF